jgi:hypothetical protein
MIFNTSLNSSTLHEYAQRISTKDFDNVGQMLLLAFKDVQLILESSADVHVPLPYANSLRDKVLATSKTVVHYVITIFMQVRYVIACRICHDMIQVCISC